MKDKQIEQLFFIQRDATVGVLDGALLFLNPASQARYPDLCPGASADALLPRELLERTEETFSASATIREELCTVLSSRADDIRLYTLIPQEKPGEEEGRLLENVCGAMRRTLTVLSMATELLGPAIERLAEPRQTAHLTVINKSFYQLQRLCDNLDSFVRLTEGRGRLKLENIELIGFCRDLLQSVDHFAGKMSYQLHFETEHEHLVGAIDAPKVTRLLLNLISNSLKRLPPRGSIRLCLTTAEADVLIAIQDTGTGIPAAELPHVFTHYERPQTADSPTGVGMGLALAQEIANLHGGTLFVTSHKNKGTKVLLRLPLHRLPPSGLLEQARPLPQDGNNGMHIILTELVDVLDDEAYSPKYRD